MGVLRELMPVDRMQALKKCSQAVLDEAGTKSSMAHSYLKLLENGLL